MNSWISSSENSLRAQSMKMIELYHGDILKRDKFRHVKRFFAYMNRRDNWGWIILLVAVIFLISTQVPIGNLASYIHLDFIKYDDIKSAATLIDQRTSNIATIISMTLAVTAMLISNVVIKEPFIYQLLYSKSYLNFIIIYTLCTIGCLIMVGTFKDSFVKGNEYYFYNGVLCGTYMVISVLILIGHLFKTLYDFINSTSLQEILTKELLQEAKTILLIDLLNSYSLVSYLNVMDKNGLQELNYMNAINAGLPTSIIRSTITPKVYNKNKLIYNIHLKNLNNLLKDTDKIADRFFQVIRLNSISGAYQDFIYLSASQAEQKKYAKRYRKCFILKSPQNITVAESSFRDYFDQKFAESVEDKKSKDVKKILAAYRSLYDLQFKHQPVL